jgi:hypothetical protein
VRSTLLKVLGFGPVITESGYRGCWDIARRALGFLRTSQAILRNCEMGSPIDS